MNLVAARHRTARPPWNTHTRARRELTEQGLARATLPAHARATKKKSYAEAKRKGISLYDEQDFAVYRSIKDTVKKAIEREFNVSSSKMFLTQPTFFSSITSKKAVTEHDECVCAWNTVGRAACLAAPTPVPLRSPPPPLPPPAICLAPQPSTVVLCHATRTAQSCC